MSSWRLNGYIPTSGRGFNTGMGGDVSGDAVLWGLLGVNVGVFVAWQYADPRFMAANFTVSVDGVVRHMRWHTLLTSSVSHSDLYHLAPNLLALYFFGSEIGRMFGGRFLFSLYVAGALGASLSHIAYFALVVPWQEKRRGRWYPWSPRYSPPALGASGAVNACVLFSCLLEPMRIIYLNLLIPMPAIALGALFILQDLYGAASGTSRVGHAAHLGGAAVGALAWLRWRLSRGRLRW